MKKLIIFLTLAMLISTDTVFASDDRGIQLNHSRKTALVIGNSDYAFAPLKNPKNDAEDMAALLKTKGFDTILIINGTQRQMEQAIRKFGKKIIKGGVGLFYYAGHGMQVKGTNYLIPIGADITAEDEIKYESVNTNIILSKMDTAGNSLNMIFLDACRNNPFARSFRSGSKGLAQMDITRGAIIAFATAPGRTAADGDGRNGLFTKHLLEKMKVPGLEVSSLLKSVRKSVRMGSQNKQIPWDVSSLEGDFYFTPGKPKNNDIATTVKPTPLSTVSEDSETWNIIRNSKHIDDFDYYLKQFPDGQYRKVARLKIRQLKRQNTKEKVVNQKISIRMKAGEWLRMGQRNPSASITYPNNAIKLQGAPWTNGRLKNGYTDGNGVLSVKKFNFIDKKSRIKFKIISQGKYSAIEVKPNNLPLKNLSTNNSWAGSHVIKSHTWYYLTTTINKEGLWESILCTGNYIDRNGNQVINRSGKLNDNQLKKMKNSSFTAWFADNYAGTSSALYLAEASVE